MNISCTICMEPLLPTHDIDATKCGHIFHHDCVTKWFDRRAATASCPQCRSWCPHPSMNKLYFSACNEIPNPLQSKVDAMQKHRQSDGKTIVKLQSQLAARDRSLLDQREKMEYWENLLIKQRSRVMTLERDLRSAEFFMPRPIHVKSIAEILEPFTRYLQGDTDMQRQPKTLLATILKNNLDMGEAKVKNLMKVIRSNQQECDKIAAINREFSKQISMIEDALGIREKQPLPNRRRSLIPVNVSKRNQGLLNNASNNTIG